MPKSKFGVLTLLCRQFISSNQDDSHRVKSGSSHQTLRKIRASPIRLENLGFRHRDRSMSNLFGTFHHRQCMFPAGDDETMCVCVCGKLFGKTSPKHRRETKKKMAVIDKRARHAIPHRDCYESSSARSFPVRRGRFDARFPGKKIVT